MSGLLRCKHGVLWPNDCNRCDYAEWQALAAGSRRAKTAKPVECEASQSGDAKQRNAQPLSDRIEQLNQGGSK